MKRDERIVRLAENVVNYSVGVQKGERIYVECFGASAQPLFEEVIAAVTRAGGVPFYYCNDNAFIRDFLRSADEAQIKAYAEMHRGLMEDCAGYVGIRGLTIFCAFGTAGGKERALGQIFLGGGTYPRAAEQALVRHALSERDDGGNVENVAERI